MADDKPTAELVRDAPKAIREDKEPPVVARMIIEIRSDGSRTIARGALEDVESGTKTAIEAKGDSPIQLAFALMRSLKDLPKLAMKQGVRGFLLGRKK